MNTLKIVVASLAASLVVSSAVAGDEPLSLKARKHAPAAKVVDEILVKLKPGVSAAGERGLQRRLGARLKRRIRGSEYQQLKLSAGQTVEQALEQLRNDPDVESAQPNYVYRISTTTPNDTLFARQWGVKNTAQRLSNITSQDAILGTVTFDSPDTANNPGTSGKDMRLTSAWDLVTDCTSVVVAVADTGVNYNHADLDGNMWTGNADKGYNAVSNGATPPLDGHGHGTHVAGTIGAEGNNGAGVAGMCWQAKIMAIKVLADDGSGSTADLVEGLNWAKDNGAKIINMSLGGAGSDSAFQSAITTAVNAGMLVVVAAGNDASNNSTTPVYPCNYTGVLCVASLDQIYALSDFSNYSSTYVHVGAPGTNILSTWPGSVSIASEDLSTWTNSGFAHSTTLSSGTLGSTSGLVCPTGYDGTVEYATNEDSKTYKSFNFSGKSGANLELNWSQNTDNGEGAFFNYKAAGGDPFSAGTDYFGGYQTLQTGLLSYLSYSFDLGDCLTGTCTFGVRLKSNGGQNKGIHIRSARAKSWVANTGSGYNVISGTSMATPHVAGLAALIMSYHPSYTATDTANAIKSGGVDVVALSGKTTTGKAADAYGALTYIAAPTGVTATAE